MATDSPIAEQQQHQPHRRGAAKTVHADPFFDSSGLSEVDASHTTEASTEVDARESILLDVCLHTAKAAVVQEPHANA